MKLRTAVPLFAALLLGLFSALSISLIRFSDLLDQSATELAVAGESIRLAEELKSRLLTHNRNSFLYSLHGDPGRVASRRAQRAEITNILASLDLLVSDGREQALLDRLAAEMTVYFSRRQELVAEELPPVEQYSQISEDVDDAINVVDSLIQLNQSQMGFLIEQVARRNRNAELIAMSLFGVGALLLLALLAAVFRFATQPLARLNRTMESYGAGEDSLRADPSGLWEIQDIAVQFNEMADRLEQRRQDQLRLIASIAHDLRNPLNSIGLVSELLAHKSGEKDRELADIVVRQVKHLDLLVRDLMESSRIEAGQLELVFEEADLAPVLRDAVELHRSGDDLHDFVLDLPDQPLLCRHDRGRMSQVINNLLANATKYSPNGGRITVSASWEGERLRISVSDEGMGIGADELESIFKPFQRSAATRGRIPGIGLGLAASRRIVEGHGGLLLAESAQGQGATFQLWLPCTPEAAAREAPRPAPEH